YSTRGIAELTGLSQTLVSRAMRRIRYAGLSPAAQPPLRGPQLQLAELRVQYPQITLRFEPADAAQRTQETGFGRRAAAVMAALWVSGAADWPAAQPQPDTGGAAAAEAGAFTRLGSGGSSHAVCAQWGPGQGAWSAFLTDVARLLDQCRPCPDALPGELLQQLSSRAGRGLHGLWWNRAKSGAKTLLPDI